MTKSQSNFLTFKLTSINPSREQYRPYLYELTAENVYVQVPISSSEILDANSDEITITLEGLSAVLGNIADSIEKMNDEYRKTKFGV